MTLLLGCDDALGPDDETSFAFDFRDSEHGFTADFTDFPPEQEAEIEFAADHRPLPAALAGEGPALYHRGFNLSDDLFMYFKRPVEGLEPGRAYRITFSLEFASDIGQHCDVGVGPSVYLKTGASTEEPVREIGEDGWVRLNVDKGEQANEGANALILGDMRNGMPGCGPDVPWALRLYESGSRSLEVVADAEGWLWLFFGSESAFEVSHELYFRQFRAVFRPL